MIPLSFAGNVIVTVSPKPNHLLKLVLGRLVVVTDATVANRYLTIKVFDGNAVQIGYYLLVLLLLLRKLLRLH